MRRFFTFFAILSITNVSAYAQSESEKYREYYNSKASSRYQSTMSRELPSQYYGEGYKAAKSAPSWARMYVGSSIGYYTASHKNSCTQSDPLGFKCDEDSSSGQYESSGNSAGIGTRFGVRMMASNGFFVSPELFFDYLGNKSASFTNEALAAKSLRVDKEAKLSHRYGARLNFGYKPDKFGFFVGLGMSQVAYELATNPSTSSNSYSEKGKKTSPIYGAGMVFEINEKWVGRFSYDYQSFEASFCCSAAQIEDHPTMATMTDKNKVNLSSFSLGVDYLF